MQEIQMINKSSKPIRMSINGENYIYLAGLKDKQTDQKPYQKKMGLIMYAAINIRLDIIFTVKKLSQYIIDPARHHKQTIKYLI